MGSDDDDESDSDSSDIARQFANAQKQTSTLKRPRSKADSDDDDDDGGSDDGGYTRCVRRRQGKTTVDERLAGLDHQKILEENRKREAEQRALNYDSEEDDEEEDKDDDNDDAADAPVDLTKDEEDAFSSGDEEDEAPTVQQRLPIEFFHNNQDLDPQMVQHLLKAHEAANRLRQSQAQDYLRAMQQQQQQYAQQQHFLAMQQQQQQQQYAFAAMTSGMMGAAHPNFQNYPAHFQPYALAPTTSFGNSVRVLEIIVQAEIETVDGSEQIKRHTIQLAMRSDEDFNTLNTRLMEKLQIKGQNRATFKHNQQSLSLARTPDGYDLQGSCITLTAKIIVAGTGNKSGAPVAPPQNNWGDPIMLKIRMASGKQLVLKHRQKQPFSFLIEEFRSKIENAPPASALNFQFDGERLQMNQTPMTYDMEDEDLIDVKGV